MASANFTLNGSSAPPELAVTGGSLVTLELTSTSGVRTAVWSIVGNSSSALVNPTITPGGSPIGATATFTMPVGTGQGYLVQCVVNGGVDDEGVVQSTLTKRAIVGVINAAGFVPFCAGESFERSATYGYTEDLNTLANAFGGTLTLVDDSVTFAKLQNIGVGLIGNDTGTADPKLIGLGAGLGFSGGNLLIAAAGVTLAMMANIATATFIGRTTAGTGAPEALTATQATAMLNVGTTALKGLVAPPGAVAGKFYRDDHTWASVSGTFTAPSNPGDDGKLTYASAGSLAFASAIKTDGTYLAFGGVNPATLTIGANRYAHNTRVSAGLAQDGTTNVDLVQWGVGTNNKLQLGSSGVAIAELTAKQLKLTGVTLTGLTASTEASDILFDLAQTKTWATGALTTQRAARMTAPTWAFVGASVVTTGATLAISGPPTAGTNATITQSLALWLESGALGFGSSAALTGLTRFAHNSAAMVGRSSTSTDVALVTWGATTDQLQLGADGAASLLASASTSVAVRVGGATRLSVSTTQVDFNSLNIVNLSTLNGVRVANGVLGTAITASVSISVAGGSIYEIPAGSLGSNITVKITNAGSPKQGHAISIRRFDTSSYDVNITDNGDNLIYTMEGGAEVCEVYYSAADTKFMGPVHQPLAA